MKTLYMKNSTTAPLRSAASSRSVKEVWRWGEDNLLPVALSSLSRASVTHRRILIDKADYISGRGFKCDESQVTALTACCNSANHSLRAVIQRLAFDKCLFGNALLEVAIKDNRIALWHQDASRGRLARDRDHIVLHHDWAKFRVDESRSLPIFPFFEEQTDGTLRCVIHYKDYEPMFENYGTPKYIAALGAIAIAHKTDRWNISRLDNAFSLSGVMILDGTVDTPEEAEEIARQAQQRFEGNPGQVMFLVRGGAEGDSSKFVPLETQTDGDWRALHEQSTADIIVAHSWYRTLSGLEYVSGFSADRVQNEYNVALSTIIRTEQQELLEPIRLVLSSQMGIDASTLEFVNLPPFDSKPPYMRVWEARKADGLSYDTRTEEQRVFLSQI